MAIGFRHCDPRFPFLWQTADQPPARWHGAGEGPANYCADTPVGAWAEFLRHEGITEAADLAGVRRSLWAVELPDDGYARPQLEESVLFGDEASYAACQAEARHLRAAGAERIEVRGAALLCGAAGGWTAEPGGIVAAADRDGLVRVLFGPCPVRGWIAVEAGAPPAQVLALVRHF
ncbi:MAG: RES domain-containing protein [Burkholderiales bacterium]|nr:RES domain-containing protein [Burkholderiales bacterium]